MRTDDSARPDGDLRDLDELPDDAIIRRPMLQRWLRGCSVKTLIRMEQRGELPVVRLSARCIGYRVGTIRRLIADREGCRPSGEAA